MNKWGCWNGLSEVVSCVEDTKEGAIEAYAHDYLQNELEDEKGDEEFQAVIAEGRECLISHYLPDFESFVEQIEERAYENDNLEDPLVDMSKEDTEVAAKAFEEMLEAFTQKYMKERQWSIFPSENQEDIIIKFKNGEYAGWVKAKEAEGGNE